MELLRHPTPRDSDILVLCELNEGEVAGQRSADDLDLAEEHLK